MAENEGLLRTISLLTAYGSLIFYVVSVVLLGESSIVSRVLLGTLGGSLVIAYFLFRLSRPVDDEGRTIWEVYRPPHIERTQKILLVLLWGFIVIGFLWLQFRSRGH